MTHFDRLALHSGAASIGLPLSDEQLERFERFEGLLAEWNEKINLTRIPRSDVVPLQFLDSLLLHRAFPLQNVRTLIDVGTGPGFPGLPLAIAFPEIAVTLLDSTRKKLDFIAVVIRELGLKNAVVRHARAEDAARDPELRERFDCATARAVAALDILAEWLLPFVKVGGTAVALKGDNIDLELPAGRSAADLVGGALRGVEALSLPGTAITRTFAVLEKRRPTPQEFPRPATRAKKRRR